MIGTAVLLDLIGIIPGVHWVVDFGYIVIFPLWFGISDASFVKGVNRSSLKWTIVTFIIEFIPAVADVLPAMTVSVIRNVWFVQSQDKKAIKDWEKAIAEQRSNTLERNRRRYAGEETPQRQRSIPEGGVVKRIGNKVDSTRKAA